MISFVIPSINRLNPQLYSNKTILKLNKAKDMILLINSFDTSNMKTTTIEGII